MKTFQQSIILKKFGFLATAVFDDCYKIILVTVLFILVGLRSNANIFYVSTSGTPERAGTKSYPWDLETALKQPLQVKPGDTIYVGAGTYHGTFLSFLTGTMARPIIVKNEPDNRVIIDGSRAGQAKKNVATFSIKGAYTWYVGFEVTNSDTERVIPIPGSDPPERRGTGVEVFGVGVKVINCIIYDTGAGFGAWKTAINSEYYGNIIFNNGWSAPDRGHGHGVYSQNNVGIASFIDNVICDNFGMGWHIYGSKIAPLNNFYLEGNVVFNNRWLVGGGGPSKNIVLNNNFSYNDRPQFGYQPAANDSLQLHNNYFPSGLAIYWWQNVTATGNTIFTQASLSSPLVFFFDGSPDLTTFHFNNNHYYWIDPAISSQPLKFDWSNTSLPHDNPKRKGSFVLSGWRNKGEDKDVGLELLPFEKASGFKMKENKIFVRRNKYDAKRSMIVVYNWRHSYAVTVPVSGILSIGDSYELHNAENYFGDVIKGKYNGGDLIVPMAGHTVAKPLGYNETLGPNTFPEFGTFILIKR